MQNIKAELSHQKCKCVHLILRRQSFGIETSLCHSYQLSPSNHLILTIFDKGRTLGKQKTKFQLVKPGAQLSIVINYTAFGN